MEVYLPFAQNPMGYQQLVVRTAGDPRASSRVVLQEIRRVAPELAAFEVIAMAEQLDELIAPRRFMATTLALFAMVALLVAATGVYGKLAHAVAQRRPEMAIRIAMGANSRTVFGQVIREGLVTTAIGLAAGLAGAAIAVRALETLLFGVTPFDPASHLIAPVLLVLVAAVACAIPAWRAAQTDPLSLLKAEDVAPRQDCRLRRPRTPALGTG